MAIINRAASGFFNEHDTKVLETLFYPFSVRFGYREWNDVWFREALEYCDDNIYRLFSFEKQFAMEKGINEKRIKLDGSYKYFRANLKHRLSQLRQNKEYVGLISPL